MSSAREDVLSHGLIDWIDLGWIHAAVMEENPNMPIAVLQEKTLSLVRSLLEEELVVCGNVRRKEGFVAWHTSVDASMQRIHDMYITQFNDNDWPWAAWFNLTDKGWRAARLVDGVGNPYGDVLFKGLSGEVSLGSVHWYVKLDNPKAPLSELQDKTLSLVRSLAAEGLVEIGDFSDKSGDFVAWKTSIDASMRRIHKLYVQHFDAKLGWPYEVWLRLTEAGKRVARSVAQRVSAKTDEV